MDLVDLRLFGLSLCGAKHRRASREQRCGTVPPNIIFSPDEEPISGCPAL